MPKEFKRENSKDSKDKRSSAKPARKSSPAGGKGKDSKKGKKPSFERYRDDSRPSDFGSRSARSTGTDYGDKRRSFGDKPGFRKTRESEDRSESDEKPSFRDKPSDKKRSFGDKPAFRKTSEREGRDADEKPSFRKKPSDNKRSFGDKPSFRDKRESAGRGSDEKPSFRKKPSDGKRSFGDKPTFRKRDDDFRDDKPARRDHDDDFYEKKPAFVRESDKKSFDPDESESPRKSKSSYSDYKKRGNEEKNNYSDREEETREEKTVSRDSGSYSRPYERKPYKKKSFDKGTSKPQNESADDGTIRLNKYISNAGICSRREADTLIATGVVQVNGKIVTEMGYKVKPTDVIKYGGQTLRKERLVYLILNKPKDYITTYDDPQKRRTVLELIQGACKERIYPVGRLDRATTGLLMFTNDGELTKKLTHPRYGVRKVYHVELDKPLKRSDMDKIEAGLELEDGEIKVDEITYVGEGKDKSIVGIELHSGKNRIVRRIFEHLGYNVRKLDRVVFGPLTKKDMPRGRWRLLTDAEVGMLKMISEK